MCGPNAAGAPPGPLLRQCSASSPQHSRSPSSKRRPAVTSAVGAHVRRAQDPLDRLTQDPTAAPATPTSSTGLPWRVPDLCCLVTTALLALTLPQPAHAGLVLSDHIRHFEPVFYDHEHLLGQHHRAKRDANHMVNFQFTAHNRLFKLCLVRDTSLFAKDAIFESSKGPVDFDLDKVYVGKLKDDDLAEVSGVVTKDGLFDGHIKTQNNLYYLEPAKRYLDNAEFHSVMYKASDVAHPMLSHCASEQLQFAGRVHTSPGKPTYQAHKHDHSDHKHEAYHLPNIPKIKIPDHKYFKSSPLSSSSISSSASQEAKRHATDGLGPKHKAVTQRSNRNSSNLYVASDISNGGPDATTSSSRSTSTNEIKHSSQDTNTYTFDSKSWHFVNELNNMTLRGGSSPNDPYTPLPHSASLDAPLDFDLFYEPTSPNWADRKVTSNEQHSSEDNNINSTSNNPHKRGARRTRAAPDPSKTTCMLYLQADHLFYEKIGSEEACIDTMTRHVQRVNSIYKITDFDLDHDADNIGFMIKRIKVHTSDALNDPSYRFPGNYGVEKFLELFSEEDYDSFCLAYMFTYRDFEGGTLGLAWTGDLKNAGGVCEKNGHYRGSLKSLNTGIVTLLNYGKHVPPAVSHVTLAHEIGHNFGSPHDPESDTRCTPGGEDGNYIMFARATSGDKKNNNKFSPCSLRQINSVLNSKARDSKGCFTEPQAAICGNGVVEVGEECDCGWEEDCEEHCCFPMKTNPGKRETPCTLRPGKTCSPTQGPCCDQNCRLKIRDKCRDDNGCRDASFCNGQGPSCPSSTNKPNKTICNDEFVCYKGECTGSICLAYGLDSCQCRRQSGDPVTKSCELCCKLPGEDQPCISSFVWNSLPYNIPDMYAKAGTPCDEYKGYCDVFNKCREVDPSGPLATLRRLLLSDESLANLQRWVVDHWYAVLFVVVAFIILMVAVIKVFGKTPEKLKLRKKKKKRTILHKNSFGASYTMPSTNNGTSSNGVLNSNGLDASHDNSANGVVSTSANGTVPMANGTMDYTENHANHVVHPTVVRANIPFKRKVNEVKRAATKAKRAARSQLSRSGKKSSRGQKDPIASPSDSNKSVPAAVETPSDVRESRVKDRLSSRFSIISFKTFRPKSLSPDKQKGKSSDKNKSKSGIDKKNKSKSTKNQNRSRSPDKKRRSLEGAESPEKHKRSRSPSKRGTKEDERRKSRNRSVSPDKMRRSTSPDKYQRHRNRSPDKHRKMSEGNWLINKFLADEERTAKPIMNGSLICSMNDSLSSINTVGGPNSSPLTVVRNGSTRALLATDTSRASPIRGIVNEAFISSPRGARTHSSLRVTKSVSPEGFDFDLGPNKYRRSISMEAYNRPPASPDKRKRSILDEGLSPDKRRRFSSPEKHFRSSSPAKEIRHDKSHNNILDVIERRRSSISPPSSKHSSKNNSYSSVPERLREKLSLITASPSGSIASIMAPVEPSAAFVEPTIDTVSIISSHSSHSASRCTPKDWV